MADTIRDGLVLIGTRRMKSSRNGNPRFLLIWSDGTSDPTQPDAGMAYGIENRENFNVPLRVHFSRNCVSYVEPIAPGPKKDTP